ncbi:MAG TPA: hypothetical protein VHD61_10255 [Lacunisphaera sp.]|nr:hypothetical protein [Lacunisphaera sp.]
MKPASHPGVSRPMRTHRSVRFPSLAAASIALLLMAGCASEEQESVFNAPEHREHPRPAPLAGSGTFFAGTVAVDVTVGAMDRPAGMERHDGSGGGEHWSGGRRHAGRRPSGDGDESSGDRPEGAGAGPMMHRPMGAPEMIHLKFTNHGTGKVVVAIADFVSPLGNFAVQPETLALEPGQSVEVEPMSSQLAGPLAGVDATLVLRAGGKTEKQVIHLQAVTPPATAASPAEAPPAK